MPYIKKGLVKLNWADHVGSRATASAYENAIKYYAVNDSEWLLFLDVDEFIVPVNTGSVNEVLARYSEIPAWN